jgi:hypothetical protein
VIVTRFQYGYNAIETGHNTIRPRLQNKQKAVGQQLQGGSNANATRQPSSCKNAIAIFTTWLQSGCEVVAKRLQNDNNVIATQSQHDRKASATRLLCDRIAVATRL